jgi:hypothetical protein
MTITVRIENVYGNRAVYPCCAVACKLAALAGTKTLTPHTLRLIQELGYTVRVQEGVK